MSKEFMKAVFTTKMNNHDYVYILPWLQFSINIVFDKSKSALEGHCLNADKSLCDWPVRMFTQLGPLSMDTCRMCLISMQRRWH
ncbi:hypothetical protein KIN20_016716 [Parelaphostrongylus tenuis]|uniref:Uncharacterized protein n=1 Tax=Parelaphostrongylus tenuis TaxID=148309 RepID=A0AAD5QQZ5_PARTN|nr:hypothetical protein KIN20_016716 [Parelaphostrongylus tenuis]